jgi:hypothetical protein
MENDLIITPLRNFYTANAVARYYSLPNSEKE